MLHRYILFLFISLFTLQLSAQDIQLIGVRLTSDPGGVNVPSGIETGVALRLLSSGAVIPAGDSIDITATIHGQQIDTRYYFSNDISPLVGNFIIELGLNNTITVDGSLSSFTASASIDYANDTVDSNDHVVDQFFQVATSGNDDWAVIGIDLLPEELLNFDIDNGTNIPPAISALQIQLVNTGDFSYIQGTRLDYSITLDTLVNLDFQMDHMVTPMDSISRTITNQSVLPTVPNDTGSYDLCASIHALIDANASNDTYCRSISIVDNFDPTDPLNWPNGLHETDFADTGYLILDNGNQPQLAANKAFTVEVYSMLGQKLKRSTLKEGELFDTHFLSAGNYVIRLSDSDGQQFAERLVVR